MPDPPPSHLRGAVFDRLKASVADRPGGAVLARVAVGVIAGLLTWRTPTIAATGGLDGSWQAAIVLAFQRGLHFGPEIDFTWGPLGFLGLPALYDPRLGSVAWAFTGGVHLALCVAISVLAGASQRRAVTIGLVVVGAIASSYVPPMNAIACLLFLVLVARLGRPASPGDGGRWDLASIAVISAGCAIASLVRLNEAVVIVVIGGAIAAGGSVPKRAVPVFLAAYAASFGILWLLAGQRLSDIPDWVGASVQIVLGYTSAMSLPNPARGWETIALCIATVAAIVALSRVSRDWRPGARLATAVAFGIFWFVGYKHGFVRQPAGGFFAALLLVIVWLPAWRPPDHQLRWIAVAVLGMAFLGTQQVEFGTLDPLGRAGAAIDQARTIANTQARVAMVRNARAQIRAAYDIPEPMLARIGRGRVHIAPNDAAVAWAYPSLRWDPLPIFQAYSAYTADLDARDAADLSAVDGPQYVLRKAGSEIDGRSEWYEAPQTMLALACNFEQVLANPSWQLLERRPSRCSAPRPIGSIAIRPGILVSVPPGEGLRTIVTVRLDGAAASTLEHLQGVLATPSLWTISLTHTYDYRLIPATATGPMIVRSARGLVYPRTYAPPSTSTFTFFAGPRLGVADAAQQDELVTVTFEAIEIAPWPDVSAVSIDDPRATDPVADAATLP